MKLKIAGQKPLPLDIVAKHQYCNNIITMCQELMAFETGGGGVVSLTYEMKLKTAGQKPLPLDV